MTDKNLLRAIILILIIAVLVLPVLFYVRILDPMWNPFRLSAEKAINKMLVNFKNATTVQFNLNIKTISKEQEGTFENFHFFSRGDLEISTDKSSQTLDILAEYSFFSIFSMIGERRKVDNISYYNFTNFQIPYTLDQFFKIIGLEGKNLIGSWLKYDQQALINGLERHKKGSKDSTGQEGPADKEGLNQKLIKLVKENPNLLTFKEELPDLKINGKRYYRYLFQIDKEKLKELAVSLIDKNVFLESPLKDYQYAPFISKNKEIIKQYIIDFFNKIESLDLEIAINRRTYLPYLIAAEIPIDNTNTEFSLTFPNFNKLINIEIPPENKPFESKFAQPVFFLANTLIKK